MLSIIEGNKATRGEKPYKKDWGGTRGGKAFKGRTAFLTHWGRTQKNSSTLGGEEKARDETPGVKTQTSVSLEKGRSGKKRLQTVEPGENAGG